MSPDHLFVTGCYRSGTTLVEKLLHQHPQVSVASQPAPVLYFLAKERFLSEQGLDRRYPLDHLYNERDYNVESFNRYLATLTLGDPDLDELLTRLREYSTGLWTPQILDLRDRLQPGLFLDVQRQIHELIAERLGKRNCRVVGSKEILCDEFAPHLLAEGHRVIVVIRDPRDMIASLDYRHRDNLTGDHRPILYSLRLWRKSVAFALALRDHPRFAWVRFEDLIGESEATLTRLVGFLRLGSFPLEDVLRRGIRTQTGDPWRGNSSFEDSEGISPAAVGRFPDVVPPHVVEYIEALTQPEMRLLGYEAVTEGHVHDQLLQSFREPFSLHERFDEGYATDARRVDDELRRLQLLRQPDSADPADVEALFIFGQAFRQLVSGHRTPRVPSAGKDP